MDNVTHTLAGLVLAEATVRARWRAGAEPSSRFRAVASLSAIVAANLPDADLFYTGIDGDRLTYMLHHRGHTHTVVLAVVGALLLWGVAWAALRWRAGSERAPGDAAHDASARPAAARDAARADARALLALVLVAATSHLVLDWTNSYGVHPFWPFDDRWRYGDAVFIVEPWFWVVSIPMLVVSGARRLPRVLLSLVLLLGLALAWRVDLVSRGAAIALTVGAAVAILLALRLRPGPRLATTVVAWVTVTLAMAGGSARARAATVAAVGSADPSVRVLDVVVTPLPANPLCASVIVVERAGAAYRVATARVSALPSVADASRCGARGGAGPTFAASARAATAAVRWDAEWTAPAAELVELARASCPALAALRFIRVPIWRALDDSTVMLGDARYGGASGSGFSDVRVPRRETRCPDAVPPWVPPRDDLLRADFTTR